VGLATRHAADGPHSGAYKTRPTNAAVRQELLRVLGELGEQAPDVRFGQLLANLSYMAKSYSAEAIWDVEDEELLEAAKTHLGELASRHVAAP
jgi:hypothetical protein